VGILPLQISSQVERIPAFVNTVELNSWSSLVELRATYPGVPILVPISSEKSGCNG
jgi:hypothetical protein